MSSLLRRVRGVDLDLFCLADQRFFDDPRRHRSRTGLADFEVADLPPGCRQVVEREWVHILPEAWQGPSQGWKVHVSVLPAHAAGALAVTARFCLERGIAFKHLRSEAVLLTTNAKYAARSSSGKFIAVYPRDEAELFEVLDGLDPELSGLPGPYVLSDLRWHDGPLYVRWGGFATRHCVDEAGARQLAVEDPTGVLVPDERQPFFSLPEWVTLPSRLAAEQAGGEDLVALSGFSFQSALHFSNGGGVYRGVRALDGRDVVLKEARPHAGLDSELCDAVTRLGHEHEAYLALGGLDGLPGLVDRFELWEHHYLVTDHVDGRSLQRWMAAHHPALQADPSPTDDADYAVAALDVIQRTADVLASVHAAGWVHGDLHPGNVLVDDDGAVHLIDLEQAKRETDARTSGLGCPGFVRRDRSGEPLVRDDDLHALGVLAAWLFAPFVVVSELDPSKPATILAWVRRRFDLPAWWEDLVSVAYGPGAVATGSLPPKRAEPLTPTTLAAGLRSSATPGRDDRLFPGDVVQVIDQGLDFATGAAGVLWALAQQGDVRTAEVGWLLERRHRLAAPGFHDGRAGVGAALVSLGAIDEGVDMLTEAADAVVCSSDLSLAAGRAGVGLLLLAHADVMPDAVERAQRLADGIEDLTPTGAPTRSGLAAGFVDGWAGVSCFLARLAQALGDDAYAARAASCLRRDVAACVEGPDGALLVDESGKLLPYLAFGSAGIALAAAELADLGVEALTDGELAGLVRALAPELVLEPGLLEGRAGLMWTLHRMHETGLADTAAVVGRHRDLLAWQTVPCGAGTMALGRNLRRASGDIATGTAGLLAVLRTLDSGPAPLPVLPVTRARVGAAR